MSFGVLAPAGTPAPVIAQLNGGIRDMLADPELQKRFVGEGWWHGQLAAGTGT